MTYLITQILLCLSIAFILGFLLGWLFSKICSGSDNKNQEEGADHVSAVTSSSDSAVVSEGLVADYDDTATIELDTAVDLDAASYDIETMEGIGPQTGNLFRGYGVATVGDFLRKLHQPLSREQAAKDLNILVKPIHDWASMADLLRVEGIDHQYAELVYATGIQTVGELARSESSHLVEEMERANNAGKQLISPTVPSTEEVDGWIARAKNMSPVVSV